jgi:hypothetical protein
MDYWDKNQDEILGTNQIAFFYVITSKAYSMKLIYYAAMVMSSVMSMTSCVKEPIPGPRNVMGKMPVYLALDSLKDIRSMPPQPIVQTGTIFLLDSLFFVLDYRKGVHVFSFLDSANTEAIAFLKVPAATDFSVSGSRMYVDSWRDLITIDISNLLNIKVLSRSGGVFSPSLFPPLYRGSFECVDEMNGAVIDWKDTLLTAPKCQTF